MASAAEVVGSRKSRSVWCISVGRLSIREGTVISVRYLGGNGNGGERKVLFLTGGSIDAWAVVEHCLLWFVEALDFLATADELPFSLAILIAIVVGFGEL